MADYSTPLGKFEQQRRQAKQRNIEWLLTFEEWWSIWKISGKWEQRGKCAGQFVMARSGDIGPYSSGNVYICLASENHSHAHTNQRIPVRPKKPRAPRREVKGWTRTKKSRIKPYQVMCGDKYVGCFATEEEARDAYLKEKEARALHTPNHPFFVSKSLYARVRESRTAK